MIFKQYRIRRNERQRRIVHDAIKQILLEQGVVQSSTSSFRDICKIAHYNRSIEIPVCGPDKSDTYVFSCSKE